jgi:HAD superfamily hydrolase (TIGR01509 family)
MLRSVLLDVDGTLLDSNDAHASAWVDTFREFGYDVPFAKVRRLIGMGSDKLLPETVRLEKDSEQGKALGERRTRIFEERYLHTLRPFPRARDLLERMREDGLTLVVATSATKKESSGLLAQAGVADLMDEKTTSSDAKHSKPDPDIVQAALDASGAAASEVIMLGDTPYDVEAATRAHIAIVALRCGGWDDESLRDAIAIYDDPATLLDAYDDSPFGRRMMTTASAR